MGLDMFLNVDVYIGGKWRTTDQVLSIKDQNTAHGDIDLDIPLSLVSNIKLETGYWRKANAIHQWFVENCGNDDDNCQEMYVSTDSLKELKGLCKKVVKDVNQGPELLPTQAGFFFGETYYDENYLDEIKETIAIIDKTLRIAKKTGGTIYYNASW